MKENKKEIWLKRCCIIILVFFAFFILTRAFLGEFRFDELDSNALPTIALQYRGSIVMSKIDLQQAQIDYPSLYNGINTYDDLRSAGLIKLSKDAWLAYYFPIYPLLCIPVKLIFSLLHVDQTRTFSVTNAMLIIGALLFVYRTLNVNKEKKLIALLLLIASPIVFYVNYINYESFLFSMVTIAFTLYYNKKRKSSAFFLSLAGISNITVMAAGIVMIIAYFINIYTLDKGKRFSAVLHKNAKETVYYAMAFLPCFLYFIPTFYAGTLGATVASVSTNSMHGYWGRVLSYLFEPNLGLTSFAPLQIVLFLVCVTILIIRKKYASLTVPAAAIACILAVSLMTHINCGMIYCARYLVWIYPIIAMFLAVEGLDCIRTRMVRRLLYGTMLFVTITLFYLNFSVIYNCFVFNESTLFLLDSVPMLYNPLSSTFYSRLLHIDGAYKITYPAYYVDSHGTGEVRKLIFKADPGEAETVVTSLIGDEESVAELRRKVERIKTDGKFHYINFPKWSKYALREKTPEEKGEVQEARILVNETYVKLFPENEYFIAGFPIELKQNTIYKIEIELPSDYDFDKEGLIFIDFFANGYDRAEQQVTNFCYDDIHTYTFYIDSGTIETGDLDAFVRIYSSEPENTEIESFEVTEMERVA